tara:strand:- start:92 stop:472 length:381 start_codon:yes stop_codon:yes gene_type:complete
MGIRIVDHFTLAHFFAGFLSYICLNEFVSNVSNFVFANSVHFLMELLEHNFTPDGVMIESKINHVSDITAFAAGWFLSTTFNIKANWFHFVILLSLFVKETYRELYPYSKFGAFREHGWIGPEKKP